MNQARRYITQFDSSTSMLYALGGVLNEKGFSGVQVVPPSLQFAISFLNIFPYPIRKTLYRWSGGWAALDESKIANIDENEIQEWVVSQYPERRYPAILMGSSNGAIIHLAAALGIPWLPQTFLLSVRRSLDPDEIEADIEWGRTIAPQVRKKNPHLRLCQMHDPVQDRLMVARMGYFRMKFLKLGEIYEKFIRERLEPGGTIFIVDNSLPWPLTEVGPEHTFQIGGLGALNPHEYLEGSPRVRAFLKAQGSTRSGWKLPGKILEGRESEWGFARALEKDILQWPEIKNYAVKKISFEHPEDPSPWMADLYQWWYQKNGINNKRLVGECFALQEPWLMLKTASIPFWMAFNTEPSFQSLQAYMERSQGLDEIYLMLMSNGVSGIGQVPIEKWKSLLMQARKTWGFLGVQENKYPMDFTSFVRYHNDFKSKIAFSPQSPSTMKLSEFEYWAYQNQSKYKVLLTDISPKP